ncbi:hypothetical protein V6N13_059604 [Hibiscus sabdariffa]
MSPFIRDETVLTCGFSSCNFSFVGQNENQVAHAMAVAGSRELHDRYWIEDAPGNVLRLAANDQCFLVPL